MSLFASIYRQDWDFDLVNKINLNYISLHEQACIENGVRKFNVNTEVRKAYLDSLNSPRKDLVHVMESAKQSMKAVIAEKMHLFGSAGKAL